MDSGFSLQFPYLGALKRERRVDAVSSLGSCPTVGAFVQFCDAFDALLDEDDQETCCVAVVDDGVTIIECIDKVYEVGVPWDELWYQVDQWADVRIGDKYWEGIFSRVAVQDSFGVLGMVEERCEVPEGVSSSVEGYCYLQWFPKERRQEAAAVLGGSPTVAEVFWVLSHLTCGELKLSDWELRNGRLHVVCSYKQGFSLELLLGLAQSIPNMPVAGFISKGACSVVTAFAEGKCDGCAARPWVPEFAYSFPDCACPRYDLSEQEAYDSLSEFVATGNGKVGDLNTCYLSDRARSDAKVCVTEVKAGQLVTVFPHNGQFRIKGTFVEVLVPPGVPVQLMGTELLDRSGMVLAARKGLSFSCPLKALFVRARPPEHELKWRHKVLRSDSTDFYNSFVRKLASVGIGPVVQLGHTVKVLWKGGFQRLSRADFERAGKGLRSCAMVGKVGMVLPNDMLCAVQSVSGELVVAGLKVALGTVVVLPVTASCVEVVADYGVSWEVLSWTPLCRNSGQQVSLASVVDLEEQVGERQYVV